MLTIPPAIPPGAAIVERIGWENREDCVEHSGGRTFTATLVFTNGAPELPMEVVWKRLPVLLTIAEVKSDD